MTKYVCETSTGSTRDGMIYEYYNDAFERCKQLEKGSAQTWIVVEIKESESEQDTGSCTSDSLDLSWLVWIFILLYLFG